MTLFSYDSVIYHCEKGEMTPELCDDLAKIPFDLQDVPNVPNNIHNGHARYRGIRDCYLLTFIPSFLFGVKMLVHITLPRQPSHVYIIYETAIC